MAYLRSLNDLTPPPPQPLSIHFVVLDSQMVSKISIIFTPRMPPPHTRISGIYFIPEFSINTCHFFLLPFFLYSVSAELTLLLKGPPI